MSEISDGWEHGVLITLAFPEDSPTGVRASTKGHMAYFYCGFKRWNVTHIPSGMSCAEGCRSENDARQLADTLAPLLPTHGTIGEYEPLSVEAKEAWKAFMRHNNYDTKELKGGLEWLWEYYD